MKSVPFVRKRLGKRPAALLFFVILIPCLAVGFYFIKAIPQPEWWLEAILTIIGKVIVGFVVLVVSVIPAGVVTLALCEKAESFHVPAMKKEFFSKACGHLRCYYKLQEPYLVTKCFDATNKCFKNHDVCIFVVGDELRMTTDLMRGFLHGERELGCYAFKKEEIVLSKKRDGKQLRVELKVGETAFLLGYRAKGFIEKSFIGK